MTTNRPYRVEVKRPDGWCVIGTFGLLSRAVALAAIRADFFVNKDIRVVDKRDGSVVYTPEVAR